MHHLFIYIFFISVFLSNYTASAQERNFEDLLDNYETLCGKCLDLRSRMSAGEKVSRNEAQLLIERFLTLNKEIKAHESEMTVLQRRRFTSIGKCFSSGGSEVEKEPEALPKVQSCFEPLSLQMPLIDTLCFSVHDQEVFRQPSWGGDVYILAQMVAPDEAYGLLTGFNIEHWGAMLSFRSNYVSSPAVSYSCNTGGIIENGGYMWMSGAEKRINMSICCGPLYKVNSWLSAYVGLGYGVRKLVWEDVDGNWALVSDWSVSGLAAESGLLFSWRLLSCSLGISTVKFRTAALTFGIGIKF